MPARAALVGEMVGVVFVAIPNAMRVKKREEQWPSKHFVTISQSTHENSSCALWLSKCSEVYLVRASCRGDIFSKCIALESVSPNIDCLGHNRRTLFSFAKKHSY